MSQLQIDRLRNRVGRNNVLTKCECFLPGDDGPEDWSFYVKPLTMMELVESRQGRKKGEQLTELETTVKLIMVRCLNADGSRMYQSDAWPFLMRMSLSELTILAEAMNLGEEEEEVGSDLDVKSPSKATKK
jgi:hypothetical protein